MNGVSAGTCRTGSPRASPADSTVRDTVEIGAGIESQCHNAQGGQSGHILVLLVARWPHLQAGGHHKFAARQVRRGIGKLDGVRPADHPVGILASGHQRQAEVFVLSQAPDGDRHG
jgi:hypothetical protein